jgi:hypothetical protein
VIREDRELLTELARLKTAMAALAMRIIDGAATTAEPLGYVRRLVAAGEQLRKRANETAVTVVDGEVVSGG